MLKYILHICQTAFFCRGPSLMYQVRWCLSNYWLALVAQPYVTKQLRAAQEELLFSPVSYILQSNYVCVVTATASARPTHDVTPITPGCTFTWRGHPTPLPTYTFILTFKNFLCAWIFIYFSILIFFIVFWKGRLCDGVHKLRVTGYPNYFSRSWCHSFPTKFTSWRYITWRHFQ